MAKYFFCNKFVNEMFLNAGNRVKNKRIELVSKPVK